MQNYKTIFQLELYQLGLNNGNIDNRNEIDIIENNSNPSCTNCDVDNFPMQMNSQYFQADAAKTPQTIRNKGNFLRSGLSDTNPQKIKVGMKIITPMVFGGKILKTSNFI